jgi:hypothetical protein
MRRRCSCRPHPLEQAARARREEQDTGAGAARGLTRQRHARRVGAEPNVCARAHACLVCACLCARAYVWVRARRARV